MHQERKKRSDSPLDERVGTYQEPPISSINKALETLLAYNIHDVISLQTLMVLSYNLKLKETPFNETHQLPLPSSPEVPFQADLETIEKIKSTMGSYRMW